MSEPLTLYGIEPDSLLEDVYFSEAFCDLHTGRGRLDVLTDRSFRCMSAVHAIEGTDYEDMETPWGYGGPVALDEASLLSGVSKWRRRQSDLGRVAEFVRLHPFTNPLALRGLLDQLRFDRLTVLVDLNRSDAERQRDFNKGTRHAVRRAAKRLEVRLLQAGDEAVFESLYNAGLQRNQAADSYYFPRAYFKALLDAPWSRVYCALLDQEPVAVACFIHGGKLVHYHLSGGDSRARDHAAHYLLLCTATGDYADEGRRWMHLGGGRTSGVDDALLAFKRKFGTHLIPFYTGGIVFDRETYTRLSHGGSERFLSYRFAPSPAAEVEDLTMEVAAAKDFSDFFRLKCDIDNIVWSGAQTPPAFEHLRSWFHDQLVGSSNRTILIARSGKDVAGYAYADIVGDAIEVSVGLAASQIRRRAFRAVLAGAVDWVREHHAALPMRSWLYDSNRFQVEAFADQGFAPDAACELRLSYCAATDGETPQRAWALQADVAAQK